MADDPCAPELPVATVEPDGTRSTQPQARAEDPGQDCFFVYSAVSEARSRNASLLRGPRARPGGAGLAAAA